MNPKREIKSKEFLSDIRGGMTPEELMEKYGLSSSGFRQVVELIVKRRMDRQKRSVESNEMRRHPRKAIDFPLWIYEGVDQLQQGRVLDLSEQGVRIQGLPAKVGDECTFIARARSRERQHPFVFDAVCRWTSKGDARESFVAGFEITHISASDATRLKAFL
jgi:hypothetical protein